MWSKSLKNAHDKVHFQESRRLPDFFKFWNSAQAFFKEFDYNLYKQLLFRTL